MENPDNFGKLLSEHSENKTATGSTLVIGLVCLGLSVAMVVFFFGEKEISFNKVLFGLSALFALGGGLSCLWTVVKNRGGRVELYENGIVVEKGGKRQTASWNDIAVVKEKVEQMHYKGSYIYDRDSYTIEKNNGEIFDLSNMISEIGGIGRVIEEKTLERLYPQAVKKIKSGGQVMFDSLAADQNGLGGLAWTEMSGVKIKNGLIEVKDRAGQTVINGSYGATPNAHLLVALMKDRLPIEYVGDK